MKRLKKDLIPLSFMVSIIILLVFYKILNNGDKDIYNLVTGIDKAIPFLKIFILPYVIWYGYIIVGLIYLCIKNRKIYYISLISLNIGLVICYIIYAFFQTTVPRPVVTGSDVLSRLVGVIYKYDNPFNCFPSMHVTTTYIIIKAINRTKSSIFTRLIFNMLGILIIISTQFIKQHVILDLVFSVLLCEVIFKFVSSTKREDIATWKRRLSCIFSMKSKFKNPS